MPRKDLIVVDEALKAVRKLKEAAITSDFRQAYEYAEEAILALPAPPPVDAGVTQADEADVTEAIASLLALKETIQECATEEGRSRYLKTVLHPHRVEELAYVAKLLTAHPAMQIASLRASPAAGMEITPAIDAALRVAHRRSVEVVEMLPAAPHPEPTRGVEAAFEGNERIDREALNRYRSFKWGHDAAGINLTTLGRLIATIDALEARASLAPAKAPADVEERVLDIERDIRIAIWNAGKWQGKPDEVALSLIRKAMAEPPMIRALANIKRALTGNDDGQGGAK